MYAANTCPHDAKGWHAASPVQIQSQITYLIVDYQLYHKQIYHDILITKHNIGHYTHGIYMDSPCDLCNLNNIAKW